jgi:hypothetical protein
MNNYRHQIETAIQGIRIYSLTSFSWFGKRTPRIPQSIARRFTSRTARSFLHYSLQAQLYRDFYSRGFAGPSTRETRGVLSGHDSARFLSDLEDSNAGKGHKDANWSVIDRQDQALVVEKDRLRIRVEADSGVVENDGEDGLTLLMPKGLLSISPGFYMALSDASFDDSGDADLRIYWNLTPPGAVALMSAATTSLNRRNIAFRLKTLNEPAAYDRCDSGVLYVRRQDFPSLPLEDLYARVRDHLKSEVPAFTKPLAPGLALAEDPGGGQSFGLHRCSLVADGLVRAFEAGKQAAAGGLEFVLACFQEAGVSLEKPFLNAGSPDRYQFAGGGSPEIPRRRKMRGQGAAAACDDPLAAADWIGTRITRTAIHHHHLCNWIGSVPVEEGPEALAVASQALGPDLYGGTAGIGLFLTELFLATERREYRDVACAALRCALLHAHSVTPRYGLGLYLGWPGIAYSAASAGLLLDEPSLIAAALDLLRRTKELSEQEHEYDLLAGSAGAIAALVTFHQLFPEDWLLDFASQLGTELIATAEGSSESGYSWPSPEHPRQPNLLGLSHGTAGIGYALGELAAATGDSQYGNAAALAFRHEANWYRRENLWPDLREVTKSELRCKGKLPSSVLWCHGAPGIALSRLRGQQSLPQASYADEAAMAVRVTRVATEAWLEDGGGNFCLCHGLAGNADVLMHAIRHSPCGFDRDLHTVVDRVAASGWERHVRGDTPWPCGTGGGETPALMLGLAGMGLFYLRRSNPEVPTMLLLEPEQVRKRVEAGRPSRTLARPP